MADNTEYEEFLHSLRIPSAPKKTLWENEKEEFSLGLTEDDVPGDEKTNTKIFTRVLASNKMYNVSAIPSHYWNESLVDKFVTHAPVVIMRIPSEYFTEERIAYAARKDHRVFRHGDLPFPFSLRTEKVALAALQATINGKQKYARRVLRQTPYKIKTRVFYEKAVAVFPHVLRHVPPGLQTWRMVVQGLAESNEDKRSIINVAKKFRVKELRQAIVLAKEDPLYIDWEAIDPLNPEIPAEPL